MSGIRPVRRYLNRRGRQRPLLGLALPSFDPIERAARPAAIRESWIGWLDRCVETGAELALLPASTDAGELSFLSEQAAARDLVCIVPIRPGSLLDDGTRQQDLIACIPAASACDGQLSGDEAAERTVLATFRQRGIPVAASARNALGAGGRCLRAAARTCDLTVIEVDDREPTDPISLVTACLAGRVEDRPAILHFRGEHAPDIERAARAAIATGLAAFLCELPAGTPMSNDVDAALRSITRFCDCLPFEMSEPRLETSAVLVLEPDGALQQPIDAVLGALVLMQRGTATSPRLLFQDRPDAAPPSLVHVPAHGPLSEAAWMLCWRLAHGGADVLITGMTLEGATTRRKLDELGIEQRVVDPAQRPLLPRWLRQRPVLDTGGRVLAGSRQVAGHRGRLQFLDRCIELEPGDEVGLGIIGEVGRAAGVVAHPFLQRGGLKAARRVLDFDDGVIYADLSAATIGWDVKA